ncbi:hypothetical protein CkaCkLH20_01960 [Colletotrichum karsti]|uniref:Uncharacterized protein n=1 Tax=Colletotrichum karsti TaxID=1095194 RepID=A0A9P6LPB4_9PEZI|nr:uncharacterized protein CkaCkLH20_01960 [Colletotrichum karsti]KAF9880918.1 hypothetical protein CkaCkLH20_01960 [Colletotrichum karsti]
MGIGQSAPVSSADSGSNIREIERFQRSKWESLRRCEEQMVANAGSDQERREIKREFAARKSNAMNEYRIEWFNWQEPNKPPFWGDHPYWQRP